MRTGLLLAAIVAAASPLAAQNPPPAPLPDSAGPPGPLGPPVAPTPTARLPRGDSVRPRPPISPTGAFLRSLVLPGWGQARLGRNVTGGVFVAFEAVAAAMVWKSQWQLEWARTRGKFVREHTQEREDWITLLVFNHLLSAAEAYVSAHLWDFPAALTLRPLNGPGAGVGIRLPLRSLRPAQRLD